MTRLAGTRILLKRKNMNLPLKGQPNGPEISTTLAPIKKRKFRFFSHKTMIRKTLLKDKVNKKTSN